MLSAHGLIPVYRGVCIPYFKIKREREKREKREKREREREKRERERDSIPLSLQPLHFWFMFC